MFLAAAVACGLTLDTSGNRRIAGGCPLDGGFARRQLVIADAKGCRDLVTVLRDSLAAALKAHLLRVKKLHESDLRIGLGRMSLPFALERKYPRAGLQWAQRPESGVSVFGLSAR
jgi:hypothetical protein